MNIAKLNGSQNQNSYHDSEKDSGSNNNRGSDVGRQEKNWCNGDQNTLIHFTLHVKVIKIHYIHT